MTIATILEHAAEHGFNVLLSGKHGVGKTALVKLCFEEAGLNWKYFSASTMDPFVDLCGVPKEVNGKLVMIRPESIDFDNVEAIFLDEYNRSHKKIRNAVMELIQFGSINGFKLPKLKIVWAAINPDSDDDFDYDVDKLDGAQIDRFHIHIDVPYEPSLAFFKDKFGSTGVAVVKWWKALKREQQLLCSPRRLEYAINLVTAGGDARYCLDKAVGIPEFTSVIALGDPVETLDKMMTISDEEIKKELLDNNKFKRLQKDLMGKSKYLNRMAHLMPEEELMKALKPKSRGSKLISFVTENPDKFSYLADTVVANPRSYAPRILTTFVKFNKNKGKSVKGSTVKKTIVSIPGFNLKLNDMHVCMTGDLKDFTRNDATALMESHGITVSRSLTAMTTHMIVGSKPGGKLTKAKGRNIPILYEPDWNAFVKELQVPPSISMVVINDVKIDVNDLTVDNYLEKTGQRFRTTKEQQQRIQLMGGFTRDDALKEQVMKLLVEETVA